ncbi:MAG TPA: SRPBCC family protein [Stellaceae bacterium]|nr:SRPBCC family protein [Stellaceae bacterium]
MSESRFVYVTYIRTTPEKLWQALTEPEFTRQYWFGMHQESDWTPGSPWRLVFGDGRVADTGAVLESDPPRRLVLKWRNEFRPELKADGDTRCTFLIERDGDMTKLTVTHEADGPHKAIDAVAQGWPQVLSSLKSFLETGKALPRTTTVPKGACQS